MEAEAKINLPSVTKSNKVCQQTRAPSTINLPRFKFINHWF